MHCTLAVRLASCLLYLLALVPLPGASPALVHERATPFDQRIRPEAAAQAGYVPPDRAEALAALRARLPTASVAFDEVVGAPKFVAARDGFLTGPNGRGRGVPDAGVPGIRPDDPHRAIKAFLAEHRALFRHGPEALERARVKREFVTAHNGMKTLVWQQELNGIPVFEALLIAHTTRRDELVNVASQFVPDPERAANAGVPQRAALVARPDISSLQAVRLAAATTGDQLDAAGIKLMAPAEGSARAQTLQAAALPGDARVQLVWLPMNAERLRLCWEVIFTSRARGETFRVLIDAGTGEAMLRYSLTEYLSDASYRVFTSDSPSPFSPGHSTPNTNQPPLVPRSLVVTAARNTNASPNGWINDGDNETRGNNVDAHLDRNNDNQPDLPRPQGSPFRVFDFPLDLDESPTNSSAAAVVQLFYWCNWMHDTLYELGFTEATGNFQVDNFGQGGLGNDALNADAQDGGGFNNANMSTLPDGVSPRMQMYFWSSPNPDRDGDFDAELVLHEYTHGLSNRRVGGGAGLSALQSRGMGEGWSDFYALALLSESGDDLNGAYAVAAYATQDYSYGLRRYPYCPDQNKNPLTFKDIDPTQALAHPNAPLNPRRVFRASDANEVHSQGEVWCVTLWDARLNLIRKHGFEIGNRWMLQLVTDGMNLSPANPNFLQARDAILQADLVNHGGANQPELWAAFAKRGLGLSATSPASTTTAGVYEAFDAPGGLPDIALEQPPGTPLTSGGSATLRSQTVGGSVVQAFSIRNAGSGALNILGVTQSGGDVGDFSVNTTGMTTNLLAGGQTLFTVSFSPTALGVRSTTLRVLSDDPDQAIFVLTLTGLGVVGFPEIAVEQPAGALLTSNRVVAWGYNSYKQTTIPAGLTDVQAIAAGQFHTVALQRDGIVVAWGYNNSGQTNVPPGLTNVAAIAAGSDHTIALRSDGSVVAWGYNNLGQTNVPPGLTNVRGIAAGFNHTVALRSDGTVLAWGRNFDGETNIPAGLTGVRAIAAGGSYNLALRSNGTVVAWGANTFGQTNVPAGLTGVVGIAAGSFHSLALKSDGTVVAWGRNQHGQASVPFSLTEVTAIAAGEGHTLALKLDGTILGWGANTDGQLRVPAGLKAVAIAAGRFHSVALRGEVPTVAYGSQNVGSTSMPRSFTIRNSGTAPLAITDVSVSGGQAEDFLLATTGMVASVPLGGSTTFTVSFSPTAPGARGTTLRILSNDENEGTFEAFLTGTGQGPELAVEQPAGTLLKSSRSQVVAWGWNDHGQTNVPAGLTDVVAIGAGARHTVALQSDGTVVGWGSDIEGQTSVPEGLIDVAAIAAGGGHTVALQHNGTVVAWGRNFEGQTMVPADLTGVAAIAAGFDHTVALLSNGTVVAWGSNAEGQTNVPAGLTGVRAIAANLWFTLALQNNGTVVAWGRNNFGQTNVPADLTGVVGIAAGSYHGAALKSDGTVAAWGYNDYGQASAPAGLTDVMAIAAGENHTVALQSNGTVVVWGWNGEGQTNVPAGLSNVMAIAAGSSHTVALQREASSVVNYGSVLLGSTSAPRTFTLRNPGTAPLTLTEVSVNGGQAGDFLLDTTGLLASVPAGGSTTFTVSFSPIAAGARGTTLRILSNDDDEGSFLVTLSGTGAVPELAVEQPAGTLLKSSRSQVVAWGWNDHGQTNVPAGLTDVVAIGAGARHTVALQSDGTVVGWGSDIEGQTSVPAGLTDVAAIAAGGGHTVALQHNGTVVAWGRNFEGQTMVPADLTGVAAIAAGFDHTVALSSNGTVMAWGSNAEGQINVPAGLTGVRAIAANLWFTLALQNNGTVLAWGRNNFGQTNVPADLTGVVGIAAGSYHGAALKSDGTVVAWGYNDYGQASAPAGLSDVMAIAAGENHTVALQSNGTVVVWGWNGDGQTNVPAGLSNVVAIAAGSGHTVALQREPPTIVDYGSHLLGSTSAPKTFTLRNTGTLPLTITGVGVSGGAAGDFLLDTTGMLASVPPGGSTTFTVSFTPIAAGARGTTLRILSNDDDEGTFEVSLTGIGADPDPVLAIEFQGTDVVISWPVTVAAFVLEQTYDLGAPSSWEPVNGSPIVVGVQKRLLLAATQPGRFFRLRKL
jgi:alpha-tubulin suppressor-like RCC1 family protein